MKKQEEHPVTEHAPHCERRMEYQTGNPTRITAYRPLLHVRRNRQERRTPMSDALEEFRRKTEGLEITWMFPGEVIEDVDGMPAGMEPNKSGVEVDGIAVAGWSEQGVGKVR